MSGQGGAHPGRTPFVMAPLLILLLAALLLSPPLCANAARPILLTADSGEPSVPKRALASSSDEAPDYLEHLWSDLNDNEHLSTFAELLEVFLEQNPGVKEELMSQPRRLTVLAPTNDAFERFYEEIDVDEDEFRNHTDALEDVMMYHIYQDTLMLPNLSPGDSITMANGENVTFVLHWDGSFVIRDLAGRTCPLWHGDDGSGGLYAVWSSSRYPPQAIAIDRVMFPARPGNLSEALSYNSDMGLFHQALVDGNLTSLLGITNANITVLVPTNDAFEDGLDAMGVTYDELISDGSLLDAFISAHVLPDVYTFKDLHDGLYKNYYHYSCYTCASYYLNEHYSRELTIMGVGSTRESNVTIIEADLHSGDYALIHRVSGMLLPRFSVGSPQCIVSCPSVQREGAAG